MKYLSIVFLICIVSACGGGSANSNVTTDNSNNSLAFSSTDGIFNSETEQNTRHTLFVSGQTRRIPLETFGIDSAFDINIESQFAAVEVNEDSILVTAPEVDYLTLDALNFEVTDERGNTSSSTVEIAYFPHHNDRLGWSLQKAETTSSVNLVVLGDGYQEHEKLEFFKHIDLFVEEMEKEEGIGPYMSAWSVHGVFTPSSDSGIDDRQDNDTKNTYFNSYFGCYDIDRLICGDTDKALSLALDQYGQYDVVALLINDERRGGAGGSLAVFSYQNVKTALHELGHTFAGLADEYVDESISDRYEQYYVEGNYPNVSQYSDPQSVPWAHWLNIDARDVEESVGIFSGSYYHSSGYYRPTLSSVMRSSYSPFGPVNTEAWVKNIYRRTPPLVAYSPIQQKVTSSRGETLSFNVDIAFDLTLQDVRWFINDKEQTSLLNRLTVDLMLGVGRHVVSVVTDDVVSIRDWGDQRTHRATSWEVEVVE